MSYQTIYAMELYLSPSVCIHTKGIGLCMPRLGKGTTPVWNSVGKEKRCSSNREYSLNSTGVLTWLVLFIQLVPHRVILIVRRKP